MRLPYKISDAAKRLYDAGVNYYATGTLSQDGETLFDYYMADAVDESQLTTLKQYCPAVQLKESRAEYAPEQKRVLVCFPKIAWYRKQETSQ